MTGQRALMDFEERVFGLEDDISVREPNFIRAGWAAGVVYGLHLGRVGAVNLHDTGLSLKQRCTVCEERI